MSDVNHSIVNAQFVEDVSAGQGSEDYIKTAGEISAFLLDKMREKCFVDRVIPVKPITHKHPQMIPSKNHDTFVYLDHIAPNSEAVSITYRDRPDANYVSGSRYEIAPYMIASKEYEKVVEELRAYPYSILQLIEDQVVVDMEAIKDYYFMLFCDLAVHRGATLTAGQYSAGRIIRGEQAVEAYAAAGGYDSAEGEPQRNDLISLGIIFSDSERPKGCLLMNLADHDRIARWTIEDLGDKDQGRVAFNGLGNGKLGVGTDSLKVLTTIKKSIVQRGDIYMFTPPEYLGRNFVLNKLEFFAEKKRNMIRFGGWGEHMTGIGNVASIAKCELYNNAASKAMPAESAVNTGIYNEVAGGFTYPQINSF